MLDEAYSRHPSSRDGFLFPASFNFLGAYHNVNVPANERATKSTHNSVSRASSFTTYNFSSFFVFSKRIFLSMSLLGAKR